MKLTRHLLKKLEQLIAKQDYRLIYEKGTFDSSYCLLHEQKVIVVNRFLNVEQRISALFNIVEEMNPVNEKWDKKDVDWLTKVRESLKGELL